jgi:hypothetical protein
MGIANLIVASLIKKCKQISTRFLTSASAFGHLEALAYATQKF